MFSYNKWTRSNTAFVMVILLLSFTGWIIINNLDPWFTPGRKDTARPSTINNAVSSIESNVMRIQALLENLTFDEYPAEIADDIESINQTELAIYKKFKEVSSHFQDNNTQYQKALALFREWKSIRDQAIEFTTNGSLQRAREIARIESAAHAQRIRAALMALNTFSEKRADDYDSAASPAAREKNVEK